MKGKLLFEEKQDFRSSIWMYMLMVGTLVVFGMLIYDAGVFHVLVGKSDAAISLKPIGWLIAVSSLSVVWWLLITVQLNVKIDPSGIYYSFYPFIRKERFISKTDLQAIEVKQYNPIMEYGGWGYRIGYKKKALNIGGDKGMELILKKNGHKLMIGTAKYNELKQVMDGLKADWKI